MSSSSLPSSARRLAVTQLSSDFRAATKVVSFDLPRSDSIPAGAALVRHHYVGINASDINFTAGWYTGKNSRPEDLQAGFEAVGVVVAVGSEVSSVKVGDAVAATGYGAFAEYKLYADASSLLPLPSADATYLPLLVSALTASVALEHVGDMRSVKDGSKKETVLVTAAAGGTGLFAVQLAKLAGHTVVATAGSDDKCEFLTKQLGVDRAINYKKEKLADVLKSEFPKGIDIVYESVGGSMFMDCVKSLAIRGRLIVIGAVSGYRDGSAWKSGASGEEEGSLPTMLLPKSASVRGFFLPNFPAESKRHLRQLLQLVQSGQLRSIVDSTPFAGLDQIADAIDAMFAGKNIGKVVVDLAPEEHASAQQKKSAL